MFFARAGLRKSLRLTLLLCSKLPLVLKAYIWVAEVQTISLEADSIPTGLYIRFSSILGPRKGCMDVFERLLLGQASQA